MRDQRLDRLAEVLVEYSTSVRKGDLVDIVADPIAMPLVEAIASRVLAAGGHPIYVARSEALYDLLM
ncbi:MAG: aminopeptidase, partial [Phycisphaerales bacterium]|nr:aminopeptidase [Phycisphaerales bacterium]